MDNAFVEEWVHVIEVQVSEISPSFSLVKEFQATFLL